MTDVQKQQARDKAKQYAELQGIDYVDPHPELDNPAPAPAPTNVEPTTAPTTAPISELSTEDLLKLVNERAGIQLSSFDDLKPKSSPEELAAISEKRKTDMLAFGLSTGKFKKEEYDSFQKESENKLSVAMAGVTEELTAKVKQANPEFTDQQIEDQVALYTLSNLPEDHPVRQQREKELTEIADSRLKNKYKNILSLENDFEQHEQGLNNQTNLEKKIKAALPVYQQDLKTILSGFGTINVPVNDTKNPENDVTIPITFSETDLQEIENLYLHPDVVVKKLKAGYTVEDLKDEAETVLLKKHWQRIAVQTAKAYNSSQKDKYIKGRKGLMPDNITLDIADDNLKQEGNQKVYEQLLETAKEQGLLKEAAAQT